MRTDQFEFGLSDERRNRLLPVLVWLPNMWVYWSPDNKSTLREYSIEEEMDCQCLECQTFVPVPSRYQRPWRPRSPLTDEDRAWRPPTSYIKPEKKDQALLDLFAEQNVEDEEAPEEAAKQENSLQKKVTIRMRKRKRWNKRTSRKMQQMRKTLVKSWTH